MQTVFALVLCAVLNNQIQWDRCQQAPGSFGTFATAQDCWNARTNFAYTFGGIMPNLSVCRPGAKECPFVQWKDRNSGPFNTTVTCVAGDLPAFTPAPPP